ncbi:MAG: hypothetical protein H8D67_30460 [Deltaproteobacteria bacterium]|nr:hypothetical protein [Deltaproteobacteria bacterium]MBL7205911.1 hypothetical protein [Desulfobacteraceae bacterium]
MYERLTTWALAFLFSVSLFGCATFKDYKPKSKEEAAIMNVLVTFTDSAKKGDVKGVSPFLHENFKAPVGKERKIQVRKEYLERLPKRSLESLTDSLGEPQMTITGNKADVKCLMTVQNWQGTFVFHLVRENGRWLIMGWEY